MLKQDQVSALSQQIQRSQIIVFALILGVAIFAGVLLFLVPFQNINRDFSVIELVGLIVAMSAVAMSVILPRMIRQNTAQQLASSLQEQEQLVDDPETITECANQFLVCAIVRNAVLEGASFLNLVLFLVGNSLVSLAIAIGLLLVMVAGFPTTGRAVDWIENQIERIRHSSVGQQ